MTKQEQTFLDAVDRALASAEHRMRDELGGTSACQIHKGGRVTGGLKYAEGRLVALNNQRRRLRDGAPSSPDELCVIVARELARWRGDLAAQRGRERLSMPWLAYLQGGVDALEELAAAITAEAQGRKTSG